MEIWHKSGKALFVRVKGREDIHRYYGSKVEIIQP